MPLFEFECRGCGQHFEYLTRDGQSPTCPSCKGADLQKLLSVFAVAGGSAGTSDRGGARMPSTSPMGACGHCGDPRGPGSCSMN